MENNGGLFFTPTPSSIRSGKFMAFSEMVSAKPTKSPVLPDTHLPSLGGHASSFTCQNECTYVAPSLTDLNNHHARFHRGKKIATALICLHTLSKDGAFREIVVVQAHVEFLNFSSLDLIDASGIFTGQRCGQMFPTRQALFLHKESSGHKQRRRNNAPRPVSSAPDKSVPRARSIQPAFSATAAAAAASSASASRAPRPTRPRAQAVAESESEDSESGDDEAKASALAERPYFSSSSSSSHAAADINVAAGHDELTSDDSSDDSDHSAGSDAESEDFDDGEMASYDSKDDSDYSAGSDSDSEDFDEFVESEEQLPEMHSPADAVAPNAPASAPINFRVGQTVYFNNVHMKRIYRVEVLQGM